MSRKLLTLLCSLLLTSLSVGTSKLTEMSEEKEPKASRTTSSTDDLEKAKWNRVFNTKIGNILHAVNYIEINGINYGKEYIIEYLPQAPNSSKQENKSRVATPLTVTLIVDSTPSEFEFILKKSGLL